MLISVPTQSTTATVQCPPILGSAVPGLWASWVDLKATPMLSDLYWPFSWWCYTIINVTDFPCRTAQSPRDALYPPMCSPHFLWTHSSPTLASQPAVWATVPTQSHGSPCSWLWSVVTSPDIMSQAPGCSQLLLFLKCLSDILVTPVLIVSFPNKPLFGNSPCTLLLPLHRYSGKWTRTMSKSYWN